MTNESISKAQIITAILEKLNSLDDSILHKYFTYGTTHKNYCFISEYASYHYLANATKKSLNTLDLYSPELILSDIIDWIFAKIIAGGGINRYNLGYLYADLVIELPYKKEIIEGENWDETFILKVNEKREDMKLSDLASTLKQFCKGDKYFIQTILEALSYSGILMVDNHSVENKFIPDYRNELSPHFYANEWTYPLRFWSKKK